MLKVYTLKKCDHCLKAKEYLKTNNIPFKEIDLSAKENGEARKFYRGLGIKLAPIITGKNKETGEEWILCGFKEEELESKLKEHYGKKKEI